MVRALQRQAAYFGLEMRAQNPNLLQHKLDPYINTKFLISTQVLNCSKTLINVVYNIKFSQLNCGFDDEIIGKLSRKLWYQRWTAEKPISQPSEFSDLLKVFFLKLSRPNNLKRFQKPFKISN